MTANPEIPSHRILVIDDNVAIHDDFRKILARSSVQEDVLVRMEATLFGAPLKAPAAAAFEVDCASQGKKGLEMVRQARSAGRPYCLAFVDGRMPPGWDGIETIGHLWRESPDLQVVLCTAYADYSWQEIQQTLGGSDNLLILKKPFDNVEVLQLAHALARKWELNREVQSRIDDLGHEVQQQIAEKEQTRALLEAAMEHSPVGVIVLDETNGGIRWTNPAALGICDAACLSLLGGQNEARHEGWSAFWTDGTTCSRENLPPLRALAKGDVIQDEEIILRDLQGREKWISTSAAPIRDADGSIRAGIIIFQDITERKRSDLEREKLQHQLNQAKKIESIGLLAGGVAHDFNNMLGAILGFTELGLMKADPKSNLYDLLQGIQKAAQRSADLTRQLLGFARKQPTAPKVLNLNHSVERALKMLRRLIGENIHLVWKPGANLWPIRFDPTQLDQILTNLCINARDAIDGNGQLIIETRNTAIDDTYCAVHPEFVSGQYATMVVSDSGPGIDREIIDHIFEPFFTTKEMGKGTGLGLPTVYGIVKQNHGFINVYSEPGKGSAFKIYLPRFRGEEKTLKIENESRPRTCRGEKVMLVEDQEEVRDVISAMLGKLGYAVVPARTPAEALRLAQTTTESIQLLITDVIMPEMNGRDLADRLTAIVPGLKCLFTSGYTAEVIGRHGVLEQGVHFIEKPFTLRRLATMIQAVLDGEE
jgi:signal transduction histidine kinase/DNA-binding response OmpR family regulator